MNLDECISDVRILLAQPEMQQPSPHVIHKHLVYNYQLIFNVAMNAAPNWEVKSYDLNVGAGTDKFLISAQDFGKPVLIHTYNADNPQFLERPIKVCNIQDLPNMWRGPRQVALIDNPTNPTAEVMCFYWQGGQPWVLVRPEPTGSATYRIWYETRVVNDQLASAPILPVGNAYLNFSTAVDCLPHAKWQGYSDELNAAKRQELGATLGQREAKHEDAFKKYLATSQQDGPVRKRPYAPDRYSGGWQNGGRGYGGDYY